jgi:hypothetical protein
MHILWSSLPYLDLTTKWSSKAYSICPIWDSNASKSIEKEKLINNNISKSLDFWKLNIVRNEMYAKAMGPYIECLRVF